MLPAVLVTLATFLLELCSSSPVYNMQPAFITNSIGTTTGRNIRNLPCVSRKNNNLHGVCMFAIDCVKSNGTHLGTCIDRFYFGSCCLVKPVHDIIDNTIDSDIMPHREPPLRLSNTTTTSTTISSTKIVDKIKTSTTTPSSVSVTPSTTEKVVTTATASELFEQKTKAPNLSDYKVTENITTITRPTVEPITRKPTITTETTTIPQKLQTFFAVDGSTVEDTTIKPITSTSKPKPSTTTSRATIKPSSTKPSAKPSSKPTPRPTLRPKPVTVTSTTSRPTPKPTLRPKPVIFTSTTSKPTKASRPPTKSTQKPTKAPAKPTRPTTTRKPVKTQTTRSPSTKKPTRNPSTPTAKPTKRVTTSATVATPTPVTKPSTTQGSTAKPVTTTTSSTKTSQKPEVLTTKEQLILTTTVSNEIPISKINVSQILETVNGNPATNEIEASRPVEPLVTTRPTTKPGLVTWTVADDKIHTEPSSTEATNATTEDWVPITTPDGWVLLPSVEPNSTNLETPETTSPPPSVQSSLPSSTDSVSTSEASSTSPTTSTTTAKATTTSTTTTSPSTSTEGKPSITYIPFESTTQSVPSSNVTTTGEPLNATTGTPEMTSQSTTLPSDLPVNMSDFTDVCGRRMFPEARIVGGEKSSYGKWPWQISLRQWRTSTFLHKCGAALLNENWAITAAHCVDQVPPSELLLRLGEHDLSTESEPYLHQERRVQIVAAHPQFDPRTFEYDLALLRFYEPVTFQPNILPVCVPQTDETFVGRNAYVTGWGRLYENGPLPSVLQEVSVPVINNTVCESMYKSAGYIEHIPHIFICAGWRRGGFDSCEGDSGGPMVIQREDRRFLLAGVISWGIGCAEPNQPGVYTRISEFRDWINQILQF